MWFTCCKLRMSALLDFALDGEDSENTCGLTKTQRFIGFAVTAFLGIFSGFLAIIAIALLRIKKFGILFSICNIMIMSSTGLLVGFKKQLKSMKEQNRYIAAIGMIVGIMTTLLFAFRWKKRIGVVVGVIVEFVSFLYYALSYVPFGRQCFTRVFRVC